MREPLPPFSEVFHALHGVDPYPWQRRLADLVVGTGRWPGTIDVPTGAGKTATLDVALYALAASTDQPAELRRAPRRIVLVVDRRTIVDQAYQRALHIRRRLLDAEDGPLVSFRDRLRALMGRDADREEPLQVALLRGGVPRDDGWVRRPDQAVLAVSTVDQVGSRLLFRGYGVRPTMWPIHAGLLGHDTLFLLDEVHLARAFQRTLEALATRWRRWREVDLPDRWQVVSLSATSGADDPFRLDAADRACPPLARRLEAHKALTLHCVSSSSHDRSGRPARGWIKALVHLTNQQVMEGHRCVGVVVNRVDTAREVARALAGPDREVLLVTGRMRGHDRAQAARRLHDRAGPGWNTRRAEDDPPFVCVATQCIEAGADLDFDALVTEVASLDAIAQRVGRVNRTGDHTDASVIVAAPSDVDADDPIYGSARAATWSWLNGLGPDVVLSPDTIARFLTQVPEQCFVPAEAPAVLLPPHLDLLAQTGPAPEPSPEPALYLHGLTPPRPEVRIVWRADVAPDDRLPRGTVDPAASARLAVVPPNTHESLALPLAAARRWLSGHPVPSFGDVVGGHDVADDASRRGDDGPPILRWDGAEATAARARDLRPGDTIVVPASFGGITAGTFDPTSREPVPDVGDFGHLLRTGRPVLRLDPSVHPGLPGGDGPPAWAGTVPAVPPVPDTETTSLGEATETLRAWLDHAADAPPTAPVVHLVRLLQEAPWRASVVHGAWVIVGLQPISPGSLRAFARGDTAPPGDDARTADARSLTSSAPVSLARHLDGVGAWARSLAEACGLPASLVADLERAGRWHDLGKAHSGFQTLLHGGDPIRAAAGDLLAKSGRAMADPGARHRAWQRAGLPRGFRHEMVSVALLTATPDAAALLDEASDPELVLHLVASHHGHARPFAPVEDHQGIDEPEEVEVTVGSRRLTCPADPRLDRADSGVSDRFWEAQRRYGWWGLAWLEAILRLADHRESEAEDRAGGAL